jgi:rhodanese-related sulfurtransferase
MTSASRRRPALSRFLAGAILLVATTVGVAACGSDGGTSSSATAPSAQAQAPLAVAAFETAIGEAGTTVLDVRTPAEYAAGHLPGAVNVDVQSPQFAQAVAELDPSGRYAVYCHSGNRSAVAVAYLVDHGFTHVVELAGGIAAWESAGRPVTTG